MKPTYLNALREASADNIRCVVHRAAWRDLATGSVAFAFLALRVLMLLIYPISTPLMAWSIHARAKAERRMWQKTDRDWLGE